jgi:hypothetical protein
MEGDCTDGGFRTLPQHPALAHLPGNWLMLIYVKGNVANSKSWRENKKNVLTGLVRGQSLRRQRLS